MPAQTEMSEGLAKELKQRGFNFCGPVIVYAFAQAIGMVNDHLTTCFRHEECAKLAARSAEPNAMAVRKRSMKPVIVWFRQDLRLADNPALRAAAATRRAAHLPVRAG